MAATPTRFVRRLERGDARARPPSSTTSRPPGCATTSARSSEALEKNAVVLGDATDADVFALAEDELEAAVQVFHVRGGRIRGQRGWVVEKVEDVTTADLVEHLAAAGLRRGRDAATPCPREVLVPALPRDVERASRPGSAACAARRVDLRVPQRGDKRALMETVRAQRRAGAGPAQDPPGRRPDHPQPGAAGARRRRSTSTRRRCASSATTSRTYQGTDVVASMVVFEDGLARKSEYRRFVVRGPTTGDGRHRRDARGASPGGSAATSRSEPTSEPSWRRRGRPTRTADPAPRARRPRDRPRDRRPRRFAYPPQPRRRRRRAAAGRRRRSGRWTSSASTTSPCAAWPSGSRRCGCPDEDAPGASCRARARVSTCSSASATRRTASPSPTTASAGQGDDDERARRRRRAGGDPHARPAQALRLGQAAAAATVDEVAAGARHRAADRRRPSSTRSAGPADGSPR